MTKKAQAVFEKIALNIKTVRSAFGKLMAESASAQQDVSSSLRLGNLEQARKHFATYARRRGQVKNMADTVSANPVYNKKFPGRTLRGQFFDHLQKSNDLHKITNDFLDRRVISNN